MLQTEIHDVLGDIAYFATQNELNKKKKKQENKVNQKDDNINKTEKSKIEIKITYPEYDNNGINENVIKLSTNLSYNHTRKRVYIEDIYKMNDVDVNNKEVKVCGWIEDIREIEDKVIVDINDGSYCDCLTVSISKDKMNENIKINGTIEVKGVLVKNKGNINMTVNDILFVNKNTNDFPVNRNDIEAKQSIYHLRPRNKMVYNII